MVNRSWATRVALVLALVLVLPGVPAGIALSSNGGALAVDLWCDRGGEGANVPGGVFQVGEEIVLHLQANADCQARLDIEGTWFSDTADYALTAFTVYDLTPGVARERDVGEWEISVEVWTATEYASDTIRYTVASTMPEASPTPSPSPPVEPTPAPPPVSGGEEFTVEIGASAVSEVDALVALKMAEGELSPDLAMDADGDGSVTVADARLILEWAVKGRETLSDEQQRLMARFSAPDTFTIVMVSDEGADPPALMRVELWNYHGFGACFRFVNGEYDGYDGAMTFEEPVRFPGFRPNQFSGDMTLEDVNSLVGDIPRVGAALVPDLMENAQMYRYDQGLVVGFQNGKLAYVRSEPIFRSGGG